MEISCDNFRAKLRRTGDDGGGGGGAAAVNTANIMIIKVIFIIYSEKLTKHVIL